MANPSEPIFLDTWYFIALINEKDKGNKRAQEISKILKLSRPITSEAVLAEFLNYFSGRGPSMRDAAAKTVETLKSIKQLKIVSQSHDYFAKSLELYGRRLDKNYSFADCFSMEIMKKKKIKKVVTNDHGFEQEGFEILS